MTKEKKGIADPERIEWLLDFIRSGNVSQNQVAKATGISQSNISRLLKGEWLISAMKLGHAIALTAYAEELQKKENKNGK